MAKDIKLLIGGSVAQAEKALRELQRTGGDVAHRLERDFAQLGTQSGLAFDQKRQAASSAYERIKQSGIATGDELKRAEKALGSELARLDEEQYGKRLGLAEKFRASWVQIAGAGLAAGAVAVGIGTKAVNEFAGFETALTNMGKVTDEPLDQIEKKIMALPPELGKATDLLNGYYQTISAGVTDPAKAMDLLVTAAKASKAAHVDQGETIKGLTKVMAGFSGEIKSATEASDLLFAMEKAGQTTFAELVPVIGDIASLSHQAGVNQKEMASMMSRLTQTAGSTSQAATQYRAILMGLIKPTSDMTAALESMGFKSGDSAVEAKGLADTLEGVRKYSEASGLGMGKFFESSEALIGLGPQLADDFGKYNSVLKDMDASAGSTDKAFAAWKGTFAAVKEAFDSSLGKALIALGKELTPMVIEAMKGITAWIEENKGGILSFFEGLGQVIAGVKTAIGWVVDGVKAAAEGAAELSLRGEALLGGDLSRAFSSEPLGGGKSITDRSDGPLFPSSSYAIGTNYVPATGLYQLHRGEEVRTRGEAARSRDSGGAAITIQGGINITLPGVTRADQSSARELARAIWPELQALGGRYRFA